MSGKEVNHNREVTHKRRTVKGIRHTFTVIDLTGANAPAPSDEQIRETLEVIERVKASKQSGKNK